MSQIKPILNRNSNFENVDPVTKDPVFIGFTETLTLTTASFLDRQDERGSEKRRVFPPLLKSRSDYIFNGRLSRRYTIAAGGDVSLDMGSVPVAPGMVVSVDIVFRTDSPAEDPGAQIQILGLLADISTVFAVRDANVPPSPALYSPGNEFNYVWDTTEGTLDLTGDDTPALELWHHVGFTVEIPQMCFFLNPKFLYSGQAAAANVVDVGQFSIQALDSRIHAGG